MKDKITVADDLLFDTADKLKRLDESAVTDDRERTRRELAIYKGYFDTLAKVVQNPHADGKAETARAFVGRHIHPAYTLMPYAITLYTDDVAIIPTKERFDFVYPLQELMLSIGARWADADNGAANVRACLDDIFDKIATLDDGQSMTSEAAARFMADIDGLRQRLRGCLTELSAVLTDTPACGESEILATVRDVVHKVDELATAAADGNGKAITEIRDVAHKVDATHKELSDSDERTQNLIHKGFEDLEPTKNGVEFLVSKKRQRISNGRDAQKKATADPDIADAKKKAAADMARAVRLVRADPDVKARKHGALKLACARVCDEFEGFGPKLSNGKFSQYAPLMDWQMKSIKWQSLRRAYNKKYGRLRNAKIGAKSKLKRVTK